MNTDPMNQLRALILEDSINDAELLLRELERGGYELDYERVQTAAEMERALQGSEWDIIFSDWSMPQFEALDALEIVKRYELDIPFIIVSGTIGEEVAVAALRSGAHDFFSKGRLVRLIPAVERELREAVIRRERTEMQEQLMIADRMASVGILAAGVGHEINNPLTSVIGNLELARADIVDFAHEANDQPAHLEEVLSKLDDAYESAERIRNVTSDLRLFAHSDGEETGPVDVRRILESSLRMAHTEIRHRSQLVTQLAPVAPVEANESRLGQVFLNLIVNAAQAITEGGVDDNVLTVETSTADNGDVLIDISDTGCGMSAEVKKRLFTPFFTTKPLGMGTGLGLSICHRIIDSYGGNITVESEVGKGSTFRVHLPPAKAAKDRQSPQADALSAKGARGKVLVIDDDPGVSMLTERVLRADHDVTVITDPYEALKSLQSGDRYDVILCDLMMPGLTGMDVYEQLVESSPQQAKAMIFVTGGAFTTRARTFLDQVENLCIEKPFAVKDLRAIVKKCVEKARAAK